MTVGKHTVKGIAENPKIAKNKAASEILKLIHQSTKPPVTTWGHLLAIYRTKPPDSEINAVGQERDILALKGITRPKSKEPNYDLLSKLRFLMTDIHERRAAEARDSGTYNCGTQLYNAQGIPVSSRAFYDHSPDNITSSMGMRPSPCPNERIVSKLPILDI